MQKNFFLYNLAKGQAYSTAINKRKWAAAQELLMTWLNTKTEYILSKELRVHLVIPIKSDKILKEISQLLSVYGIFSETGQVQSYPEGKASSIFWELRTKISKLPEILSIIENNNATFVSAGTKLNYNVEFLLKDSNGKILPNQSFIDQAKAKSDAMISLSNSSIIYPNIRFPFAEIALFKAYFTNFQTSAPFRLSDKNLRFCIWNEKKQSHIHKKITD